MPAAATPIHAPLLRRARRFDGEPVAADALARIDAYIAAPDEAGWDGIAHLIVAEGGLGGRTVWQAVCREDPTFPTRGAVTDRAGAAVSGWPRIPEPTLVVAALRGAVGGAR